MKLCAGQATTAAALSMLAFLTTTPWPSRAEESHKQPEPDGLMTIEQVIRDAREGVEFVGNDDLVKRIQANPKLVLLDVRTKEEFDAGHLKGATWIERGVAEFRLARTLRDANAEIVVYCMKVRG